MEDEAAMQSDVAPFVRGQLMVLRDELGAAGSSHRATRLHFEDAIARIDAVLEPGG